MYVTAVSVSSDAAEHQIVERDLHVVIIVVYVAVRFADTVVVEQVNHVAAVNVLQHQIVRKGKNMMPILANVNVWKVPV